MPYITTEDRVSLDRKLEPFLEWIRNIKIPSGHLNYVITKIVLEYLGERPNYDMFNSALGVLDAVPRELYRRKVAPYEDIKITMNSDVY